MKRRRRSWQAEETERGGGKEGGKREEEVKERTGSGGGSVCLLRTIFRGWGVRRATGGSSRAMKGIKLRRELKRRGKERPLRGFEEGLFLAFGQITPPRLWFVVNQDVFRVFWLFEQSYGHGHSIRAPSRLRTRFTYFLSERARAFVNVSL